jgi:peptidoglycan/LPS O-acetylase OafA/YrhL
VVSSGETPYAAAAVALVLLSGAVMALAGVLVHIDGWTLAGPITIVGGALILPAFAAARRASAIPQRGGFEPPHVRTLVATLISGAIMVLAGYGAATWAWWVGALLVPFGGLVIMLAFVFELAAPESET